MYVVTTTSSQYTIKEGASAHMHLSVFCRLDNFANHRPRQCVLRSSILSSWACKKKTCPNILIIVLLISSAIRVYKKKQCDITLNSSIPERYTGWKSRNFRAKNLEGKKETVNKKYIGYSFGWARSKEFPKSEDSTPIKEERRRYSCRPPHSPLNILPLCVESSLFSFRTRIHLFSLIPSLSFWSVLHVRDKCARRPSNNPHRPPTSLSPSFPHATLL